jgi:hypothetical protein
MFRRYDIVSETDSRQADYRVTAYFGQRTGRGRRDVEKREAATS